LGENPKGGYDYLKLNQYSFLRKEQKAMN